MQKEFTTKNAKQTQELGRMLAQELSGGSVICLDGELGAGKTTFTQGLLEGLGAEKPYTSPTFVIMKHYEIKNIKSEIKNIYHIDAYRVEANDILALGWEEMLGNKKNVIIVEWAERLCDIIPGDALRIGFEWKGEEERKIIFKTVN